MNYPFENYNSAESFIETIETNPSGHYPFGTSMFWHSGIHIFCDSQKEFVPIINGKVVCYRISQNYKEVNLPSVLSNEELENNWSEYKIYYDEKTGKLKEGNSEKKYKISDCFVLLEHTIMIEKKEFTFYTLYMNLAPVCDNPNYNKLLKTDGAIHGNIINPKEEKFFLDKIGCPGKDKKNIYFDYVLLSEQSIEKFSSQNGIKMLWGINKNISFYQRTEQTQEIATSIRIPRRAYFTEKEYKDENFISFEYKITHINVYLAQNSIDKNNNLVELSDITFADENQFIFKPTADLEFICSKVQNSLDNLKGKKVIIVDDLSKAKDNSLYVVDKKTFRYMKLKLIEPIIFWTIEKLKIISGNITDDQERKKYDKNPYLFNYILNNNIPDELKKKIENISESSTQGNDGKIYFKVMFNTAQNEKYYISEADKKNCFKSATDFDKWFYFYNENNSIVCDRTELVKETINKHDDIISKYLLIATAIGVWWSGPILTWQLLKYVYGKLSSQKCSLEGELTKPEIRKIVCCHPIEWDKNQFSNLDKKLVSPNVKERLINEVSSIDLWNGGLNKIFSKNPYFYHPIYFINHMEIAGLFEFNPYKGFDIEVKSDYNSKTKKKDGTFHATGSRGVMHKNVQDNPGFAPITTLETKYIANGWYFSNITGGFKEDYTDVIVDSVKELTYREKKIIPKIHQGIDFSGRKASKILSLIGGKVLGYGSFGNFGNAVVVGAKNGKGVYIAAHLDSFNEDVLSKGVVKPNDSIGIIGKTGAGGVVHLHVSYYDYEWNGKTIVTKNNGVLSQGVDYGEMGKYLANPFDHTSKFL